MAGIVNGWPDIQRDYPDSTRPGLVHQVADDQIWLNPAEVEAARRKWDQEHAINNPQQTSK